MIDRRAVIGGLAGAALAGGASAETITLPFANGERPMVKYPQKRPMIGLTARPPQFETPFAVFDEGVLTPNDAFFVRYHLAGLPLDHLDPDTFTLRVKGRVSRPETFSLARLKALPASEIVAVNQCSGNSRGFFMPRVSGGQLGNGAMGNARWRGVPLRAVLDQCGVAADAVQVRFDGMDGPVFDKTPDFAKAIDLDVARNGDVMLAWSMNGADLPVLNGFPLRLIVPGYYGTYWVKHVNEITVLEKPLDNFWMATAYRIPDNDCACVPAGTAPTKTRPIGRLNVRSFITSLQDGARVPSGRDVSLRGIAFDGGSGIRGVEISPDGGTTWTATTLGDDLGKYSFRPWQTSLRLTPGDHRLMVRATSNAGETQPAEPRWNPSGYMRNVIETVTVTAS
jgi:DMSO/TMAO reductase YedYZ molybdopterin-dependent catalytic subunit